MGRPNKGLTGKLVRVHPLFIKEVLDKKIQSGVGFSYSQVTYKLAQEEIEKALKPIEKIRENTLRFMKVK